MGFTTYDHVPLPATMAQLGLLAENFPNFFASAISPALTGGNIYVMRLVPTGGLIVTNIVMGLGIAGAALTAGQNFAGLYDASGNQIGVTADQSAVWTATGIKTMPLAGGPFAVNQPFVYAVLVSNGTTIPAFTRAAGANVGAGMPNIGTAGSNAPCAINGSGATALPSSLNYANNTPANGQFLWVGLS